MKKSGSDRPGLVLRQGLSQKMKQALIVATTSVLLLIIGAFIFFNIGINKETLALASGDFRTKGSGDWSNAGIWEKYNGLAWLPTLSAPNSGNGAISIESGHTVAITTAMTIDQVTVVSGGTLNITANTTTIANGAGNDLNIAGTASLSGTGKITISASAKIAILNGGTYNYNGGTQTLTSGWDVANGGTYVHNVNGIDLPVATWGASSNLKITGITASDLNGLTQSFGNFIYNCPSQTGIVEFRDQLGSIQGDMTVISTGTGNIFLQRNSAASPVNIGGSYYQTGGTVYGTKGAVYSLNITGDFNLSNGTFIETERYGAPIINIYGNFLLSGGTFNHSSYNASLAGEGIGTVNLYGDYNRTGGSHTETATLTGRGDFNFAKTGTQSFICSGGTITNTVNFTVNSGAILNMADYIITGGGYFSLSSGGGLILGSPNGITSAAASGNVQVTGTRTFSTGGDYTYSSSSAQVTGNGLPATVRNITFNNAANVTMTSSSSATSVVTLQDGKVITGSNELGTTNTSTSSVINYSETRYVVGNLRRSVAGTGSYDFPIGTSAQYEFANINFASMTGITDVLSSFTQGEPIEASYPLSGLTVNGTLVNDMLNYGYWVLTPSTPITGGTYDVTLKEKGHTNSSTNPHEYCVLKRPGLGNYWQSHGTHINDTQSEVSGVATAVRSGLSTFSHFAIGKGNGPLPVVLVSFKAKSNGNSIHCTWETSSEVNNNYFTLQRSKDGRTFTEITRIQGAGTSSNPHKYQYTDLQPLSGVSYYRVKQTDFDGKSQASELVTVSLDGRSAKSGLISITPNPIENDFKISFESEIQGNAFFVMTNLNGTIAMREEIAIETGSNVYQFSFPGNAPSGTYIVRIITDLAEFKPVKVIKH